ncbi:MAG: alpha/beta hydrolase family protein [Verrucomicrobiales bacterium]
MKILIYSAFTFVAGLPVKAAEPSQASPELLMMQLKEDAVRLDARFLEGITSREQWEARRPALRQEYLEMLGLWPLPERTPLQAQVTGTLERKDGFRVEMVHFQSRPKLYVTGNLYLPKDARAGAKLPAVLYVCGHSGRGRDGNKTTFQHHGMWFATHGHVCLIIDTLQLGEVAGIHHGTYRHDRWWWQARGYTPAGVECWNGMRAIDYLQSRPEVDPERIAVTGISGGGAATFWIAAADERVKVAVPVSGMGDLEDYVGEKVVNGHCDCMFLINTFQWPWTRIAALVAPRPLLFANSGHDTIFPMNGNDRIRSRLEKLYRFYTDRTGKLFDIGVTPGGHDDNPELRLMAYRWINRHLKNDEGPVTEPELPKIDGPLLRVFPDELPPDEINSKIDETFVPPASGELPLTPAEFEAWRSRKVAELQRIVFRNLPAFISSESQFKLHDPEELSGAGLSDYWWRYFPAAAGRTGDLRWIAVLGQRESLDSKPPWLTNIIGEAAVFLVTSRIVALTEWQDPAPFYIHRSLPLLGTTLDGDRLTHCLYVARQAVNAKNNEVTKWNIIGRGDAGVIGAYAALFEPRIQEVLLVDPPESHRDGPVFLNVLRVFDVPEALGMLAPRRLTIAGGRKDAFERTERIYQAAGATVKFVPLP